MSSLPIGTSDPYRTFQEVNEWLQGGENPLKGEGHTHTHLYTHICTPTHPPTTTPPLHHSPPEPQHHTPPPHDPPNIRLRPRTGQTEPRGQHSPVSPRLQTHQH